MVFCCHLLLLHREAVAARPFCRREGGVGQPGAIFFSSGGKKWKKRYRCNKKHLIKA